MSLSKPFSGASIEAGEFDQRLPHFGAISPAKEYHGTSFFQSDTQYNLNRNQHNDLHDEINSFFDKAPTQENFNIFNALDGCKETLWDKEHRDDEFFNAPVRGRNQSFKQPLERKDSVKSDKESETASNTKDTMYCGSKRHADEANSDTRCNTSSLDQKKFFHEDLNAFDDLINIEEKQLPSINNVVSLAIRDDSGEFSVSTKSNLITDNKILNNFLTIADSADLSDLLEAVRDCQAQVSSKISKLSEAQNRLPAKASM